MKSNFTRVCAHLFVLFVPCFAAAATCNFSTNTTTKVVTLLNDCETSSTIMVNDGYTLDGKGHTITASLESTGSFSGSAVITNVSGGSTMFVKNVIVDFAFVGCAVPQGITFNSVAGSLMASSVLHAGPSCASAVIGVYVNDPSGVTRTVTISTNKVLLANTGIQIDATSTMNVNIASNEVSAAVPLRISGAGGTVSKNSLEATNEAVILTGAPVKVLTNNINLVSGSGASVGIDATSGGNTIQGNRVFNFGSINSTGVGISNTGTGNVITSNIFRCYANTISGSVGSGNVVLPCPWSACIGSGAVEQVFSTTMHGCSGTSLWANRAAACGSGWHACTAAEWNAQRGSIVPAHNFWTGDNSLNYVSGSTNSCIVSTTSTTNLCTDASMLVCVPGGTDPEGNRCNLYGCGLDTTINQFFGGCANPNSAGTLCCHP